MTRSHPMRWLCVIGLHRYRWVFVGNHDAYDAYVDACTRCGWERGF